MLVRCALLAALCALFPAAALGVDMKGLTLLVQPERAVYSQGEPITVTLKVTNVSSTPRRLSFRSAQRYDLLVHDAQGREVWRWSSGKFFAQVMGEERVKPSGELLFKATLPGDLPPGRYDVTGTVTAVDAPLSARAAVTIQ
jgi:hypothetical protein